MFDGQKYLTRGVKSRISIALQLFMWECICKMPVKKDYLQVFQFAEENGMQKIVHSQEQPRYERTYFLQTEQPFNEKVYCIDDETHATMLLAEEY